jgi:acyl-CoA thioester hydrolase
VLSPFSFQVQVRFRDLDALGHVNNAVYLTYLESARIAYWFHVTGTSTLQDLGMILARVEVDYRSPASLGETLAVSVRCVSIRRASFTMGFEVRETGGGRLVAEARKVLVHYDYAAGKSEPLPAELRRLLRAQDPDLVEEGPAS